MEVTDADKTHQLTSQPLKVLQQRSCSLFASDCSLLLTTPMQYKTIPSRPKGLPLCPFVCLIVLPYLYLSLSLSLYYLIYSLFINLPYVHSLSLLICLFLDRGARKLTGENLKFVWAEFSTLSQAILLCMQLHGIYRSMPQLRVVNSAQVSSCQLKFVYA